MALPLVRISDLLTDTDLGMGIVTSVLGVVLSLFLLSVLALDLRPSRTGKPHKSAFSMSQRGVGIPKRFGTASRHRDRTEWAGRPRRDRRLTGNPAAMLMWCCGPPASPCQRCLGSERVSRRPHLVTLRTSTQRPGADIANTASARAPAPSWPWADRGAAPMGAPVHRRHRQRLPPPR